MAYDLYVLFSVHRAFLATVIPGKRWLPWGLSASIGA